MFENKRSDFNRQDRNNNFGKKQFLTINKELRNQELLYQKENDLKPSQNSNSRFASRALNTQDIPGAQPRNLKYKDRGKKKTDFYPLNNPDFEFLNKYYNNASVGNRNTQISMENNYLGIRKQPTLTKDYKGRL